MKSGESWIDCYDGDEELNSKDVEVDERCTGFVAVPRCVQDRDGHDFEEISMEELSPEMSSTKDLGAFSGDAILGEMTTGAGLSGAAVQEEDRPLGKGPLVWQFNDSISSEDDSEEPLAKACGKGAQCIGDDLLESHNAKGQPLDSEEDSTESYSSFNESDGATLSHQACSLEEMIDYSSTEDKKLVRTTFAGPYSPDEQEEYSEEEANRPLSRANSMTGDDSNLAVASTGQLSRKDIWRHSPSQEAARGESPPLWIIEAHADDEDRSGSVSEEVYSEAASVKSEAFEGIIQSLQPSAHPTAGDEKVDGINSENEETDAMPSVRPFEDAHLGSTTSDNGADKEQTTAEKEDSTESYLSFKESDGATLSHQACSLEDMTDYSSTEDKKLVRTTFAGPYSPDEQEEYSEEEANRPLSRANSMTGDDSNLAVASTGQLSRKDIWRHSPSQEAARGESPPLWIIEAHADDEDRSGSVSEEVYSEAASVKSEAFEGIIQSLQPSAHPTAGDEKVDGSNSENEETDAMPSVGPFEEAHLGPMTSDNGADKEQTTAEEEAAAQLGEMVPNVAAEPSPGTSDAEENDSALRVDNGDEETNSASQLIAPSIPVTEMQGQSDGTVNRSTLAASKNPGEAKGKEWKAAMTPAAKPSFTSPSKAINGKRPTFMSERERIAANKKVTEEFEASSTFKKSIEKEDEKKAKKGQSRQPSKRDGKKKMDPYFTL